MPTDDADEGASRVSRGGSWSHSAARGRAAARGRNEPTNRYGDLGFRLARPLG
jgi:formylglycine-generating enzyme required for sulfatase activity